MQKTDIPAARRGRSAVGAGALAVLTACAGGPRPGDAPPPERDLPAPVYRPVSPALPPIPAVEGALAVRVVHPTPSVPRPRVDSTFIYGSVGTGGARLSINGTPVPVAPNGAFLAYLPLPDDGVWRLQASARGRDVIHTVAYRAPQPAPAAAADADAGAIPNGVLAAPLAATVTGGADTLATGSDAIPGRPSPTGNYEWFLPRGARVAVVERRNEMYRVALDAENSAWVSREAVGVVDAGAASAAARLGEVAVRPAAGWVDVRMPVRNAPFRVEAGDAGLRVTLYGVTPRGAPFAAPRDSLLTGITEAAVTAVTTRVDLRLARPVWGYKAFYEADGTLVLRVRRPPRIDPANPLRGVRIVIDPGHPPAGATGPTGLTEAEANLAISLPLAELLRQRGAEVHLTRTRNVELGLAARTEAAVRLNGDLLVSVHNNAFGEGADPFRSHGTSTYYFHPFSAGLARALDREIVQVTGIPDLGARAGNLALARPTWMPSVLTESMFMPIPEQEAALRDPDFVRRLAEAHLRGIETFLRERAGR